VLGDATANRIVMYDSSATTGTISSLVLSETSGYLNQLNVGYVVGGITVSSTITLGSTSGTVELRLGGLATSTISTGETKYLTASAGVHITDGGLLSLQATGTNDKGITQITGNINMDGGTIGVLSGTDVASASAGFIRGTLTMTGGTLRIADATSWANNNRLYINNINLTGGSIISGTAGATMGQLIIAASGTSTIGSGVTIQGGPALVLSTNNITAINDATGFSALLYRANPTGLSQSTIKSSVTGGTTYFTDVEFASAATGTTQLILGSNSTTTGTSVAAVSQSYTGSAAPKFVLDLGGYLLNGTASNIGFTPNNTNASTQWVLQSTVGGTGAATAGTFAIQQINLSSANVQTTIGDWVTILVTGGSAANINLGGSGGGFSTTSSVIYTGSAAVGTPAIVSTNRLIPNFTVREGFVQLNSDLGQGGAGSTIRIGDSASTAYSSSGASSPFAGIFVNTGTVSSNIVCWSSTGGTMGYGRTQIYANVDSLLTGTITMATDNGNATTLQTVISATTGKTLTISGQIVGQGTGTDDGLIFNTGVSGTIVLTNSANDFSKQNAIIICQGGVISAANGALGGARSIYLADGGNKTNAPIYLLAKGSQTISAPITLNNGGSNALVSSYTIGGGDASNVTFSGNITASTYYASETSPRNFIITAATDGTTTFTGALTEATATGTLASLCNVTKTGGGTVVISNTWNHTGITTVSAGTLQIGNGAAGSIAKSGSAVVGIGASLIFDQANGSTFAGKIFNDGTLGAIASGTITLSGDISGSGAFNQSGNGRTILGGNNTYSGATTVSAGELDINGTLSNSTIGISNGATLGGSGVITGSVNVNSATINGVGLNLGTTTLDGFSMLKGYNIAGRVTVASGTTSLSGTTKSTSALSVSAGATLSANGTIAGSATVSGLLKGNSIVTGDLALTSGTLSPGNSHGITTVNGNLTMDGVSTLVSQVSGTVAGISYDQVQVSGNVSLAGTLDLSTLSGLTLGDSITLLDNKGSGSTSGYFATIITSGSTFTVSSSFNYTFTTNGTEYLLSYTSSTEGDGYNNDVILSVIPEPSTWAMLLGGIGMLAFGQRVRRRQSSGSSKNQRCTNSLCSHTIRVQ